MLANCSPVGFGCYYGIAQIAVSLVEIAQGSWDMYLDCLMQAAIRVPWSRDIVIRVLVANSADVQGLQQRIDSTWRSLIAIPTVRSSSAVPSQQQQQQPPVITAVSSVAGQGPIAGGGGVAKPLTQQGIDCTAAPAAGFSDKGVADQADQGRADQGRAGLPEASQAATPRAVAKPVGILTCNVLFEQYYQKHATGATIPLSLRAQKFCAMWPEIDKNDIICFQEFPFNDPTWPVRWDKFHVVRSAEKGCTVVVAVRQDEFEVVDYKIVQLAGGKAAIYVGCIHKRTQAVTLVIAAHLPWRPTRAEQAAELGRLLPPAQISVQGKSVSLTSIFPNIVLCGDFNLPWDVMGEARALFPEAAGDGWRNTVASLPFTGLSGGSQSTNQIDHLWLRSSFQCGAPSSSPTSSGDLVFHQASALDNNRPDTKHFSDHCLITCPVIFESSRMGEPDRNAIHEAVLQCVARASPPGGVPSGRPAIPSAHGATPAVAPGKQIGARPASASGQTFTVLSLNMLFHTYYTKHADQSIQVMSLQTRVDQSVGFFRRASACADVICLQEYSPIEHAAVRRLLLTVGFEEGMDVNLAVPDTCVVFWRRTSFTQVGTRRHQLLQSSSGKPSSKSMVTVVLQHRGTGSTMAIASAHLPFESRPMDQASTVSQVLTACNRPDGRYVVAGDFNIDAASNCMVSQVFAGWSDLAASLPFSAWTSRGPSRIDYILTKGMNTAGASCTVAPNSAEQLLPHSGRQPTRDSFFSDHSAIFCTMPAD